ncbi:MAG TPA: TROVE domain-containing protein [Blastocatellia bacterium]|nr:TROVE domain-containing protein [Blastocatellia bacterium]HMX26740.1 TROVE domain-containing protein [Blastocatellia bacterium]HMY73261.1 TROVE domain-containing protein [Blastocatellia bacterium]HMZ16566.1 TROVE domain-containing protein [Blastocatellia bacterium]HNG31648.1 TROVE domain-containing protein [Blastocatellia bacterium]
MANKKLFKTIAEKMMPKANTVNEAGGRAYKLSPKAALAQYAITGCLNGTFYADAQTQLQKVIELSKQVDAVFIAQLALYARERGHMKDMPALLCAVLAVKDVSMLKAVFLRVIDNGRMLRNFVQMIRSGAVGRHSLGTAPKRLINEWLEARSDETIFKDSVGQSPSLADVIKMIHPKPKTESRAALYGYFIGRDFNAQALPALVRQFEQFKAGESLEVPKVPFQMLTSLPLGTKDWTEIARNAAWQMTRMNLNTFARHGVFEQPGLADLIANRLRDEEAIKKARVFPYQLMAAFQNTGQATPDNKVPANVRDALQDAMEIATRNVPKVEGKVYVFPDVSGSMHSPVTGHRGGATSQVRCIDVAALVAATVLRQNPQAEVIPFSDNVVQADLNPRDSVMTNAEKLAGLPSGGTNCSAPLRELNRRKARGDLVIYVSDNESWVDGSARGWMAERATATTEQWAEFKRRNPQARLVCIDIQPYATTQAQTREDILNIGGFSDQVFDVIADFAAGRLAADHWICVIASVTL